MPARAQCNPSTLKASENPDTNKQQAVEWDDCQFCDEGKTPYKIQLTLSDTTICSECDPEGIASHTFHAEKDLSGPFDLEQTSSCRWQYILIDGMTSRWWLESETCETLLEEDTWNVYYCVEKSGDGVRVIIGGPADCNFPEFASCIFVSDWETPDSACVDTADIANLNTECDEATEEQPWAKLGHGGTVDLVGL